MGRTRRRLGVSTARRAGVGRRGQALLEVALLAPLLLLMFAGTVEVARAFRSYQVVTDATREGLRWTAGRALDSSEAEEFVREALARGGLDPAAASFTWPLGTGGFDTGDRLGLRVEYRYEWSFLAPLLGWLGDDGAFTLSTELYTRMS